MMIPRAPLKRRTFLRGSGALLALPWLEVMRPWRARAADVVAPRRVLYWYVPNGVLMEKWTPPTSGAGYQLSPILAPLAGLQSEFSVITGLDNLPAASQGVGDAHFRGTGSYLTGRAVLKDMSPNVGGPSVDQVAATTAGVGDRTAFRSLQLGTQPGGGAGGAFNYSFAYLHNISWRDAQTPMVKEGSPSRVFDRLFSGAGSTAAITPEESARRKRLKLSVLDSVKADASALNVKLGARDRQKMEQYLTGVRELELRVQSPDVLTCTVPDGPVADFDYPERIDQMSELMVLAFQCDLTRITTFMQRDGGSGDPNYSWVSYANPAGIGPALTVDFGKHNVSHQLADNPSDARASHWPLMYEAINLWELERFRYLLERMRAVDEGEGTMLDNSLVVLSNEYSTGWDHSHLNLPVLVAGKALGVTPGQHVVFPQGTPLANLHLTTLKSMGVAADSFGDSTGALTW